MKIAWFCIPAHGHTNPTLALVKAMTEAGHTVYYFSFARFREKLERAGAHFIGCDGYDFEMEDKENADRVGKDMAFATELLVSSTLALHDMVGQKVQEIQPDLIVSDSVAYWGKLTAMRYGIPYVSSTTTFAFNRYSSAYMKHGVGELFRMLCAMPKIQRQIKRLQEKGYPVKSILEIVQNDNETNTIVYTSQYYQPCAETFSGHYCFIGPSIRPVEQPMEKTADKTVYLSLGTVVRNETFYCNCIEALRETDYQVIVSLGESAERLKKEWQEFLDNLPEHIQVFDTVDQMAVLSIADVFITHCGMNSASEGLYFEVPLLLCPQTPEQEAVAKRTEELGAGIWLHTSQKDTILEAVRQLSKQPAYKQSAQNIARSFRESGGVEKAKQFLETIRLQNAPL
ncbi:MAG: glucosyltransferase [Lachnospiraceae bacterium]|nr:glucosyltransferase [Lachnospiraceae bacterium]